MRYLPRIALLLIAVNLNAQELDEQATESAQVTDQVLDPVAAAVFADDLVPPPPDVAPEMAPQPEQELPSEPEQAAPMDEQTVPVATEPVDTEPVDLELAAPPVVFGPELPQDATDEERLIFQYTRYKSLMKDRVYDEADTVAKRVVELSLKVFGPKSSEFSKALTNLAIVQHYTGQYDAAQQNYMSAIEIIENNEDRLNGQLVNPLKGLGASQLDGGRPDLASETFSRAIHVTHVNYGPHNLQQVGILESLAETSLRLGSIEDAQDIQEVIYSLNAHAYAEDSIEFVPSLLLRADWQHRAGFIAEERMTLRQAVRIIEVQEGVDDLQLVDPLILLGRTYFYYDATGQVAGMQSSPASGEIYFKRALRIATENPASDWATIARAGLALGDYYMFNNNAQRAFTVYQEAWHFLSGDEERLSYRREHLEQAVLLREKPLPTFVTQPSGEPAAGQPAGMLQGSMTLAFEVSMNGGIADLRIVDAQPIVFTSMQRSVHRKMRSRLYRPRFVDAQPTATAEQLFTHRFFYTQEDLDQQQAATAAAKQDAEQDSEQD